jgi:hypothetical protein
MTATLPRLLALASLSIAGIACVSPTTVVPGDDGGADSGAPTGAGGTNAGAGGGTAAGGARGNGTGGATVTGLGGRTGAGGTTGGGTGGTIVVGSGANLTDDFESGDVTARWLAPQSSDSTPCGTWAVVAEGSNHVYQQTSTACTSSNPSWAGGGSVNWLDMRLQVKVRFPAGASTSTVITIAVRYNGPKDLYWIEFTNDGRLKVRTRTLNGSSMDVGTLASSARVPVPDGQWTTLGLGISGGTINAYLGDNRAAAPVVTGPATGQVKGGIGIGVSNGTASFDDVLVTPQ